MECTIIFELDTGIRSLQMLIANKARWPSSTMHGRTNVGCDPHRLVGGSRLDESIILPVDFPRTLPWTFFPAKISPDSDQTFLKKRASNPPDCLRHDLKSQKISPDSTYQLIGGYRGSCQGCHLLPPSSIDSGVVILGHLIG